MLLPLFFFSKILAPPKVAPWSGFEPESREFCFLLEMTVPHDRPLHYQGFFRFAKSRFRMLVEAKPLDMLQTIFPNLPYSSNLAPASGCKFKWAGSVSGFQRARAPQYNQNRWRTLLPCSNGNGCNPSAVAAIPY